MRISVDYKGVTYYPYEKERLWRILSNDGWTVSVRRESNVATSFHITATNHTTLFQWEGDGVSIWDCISQLAVNIEQEFDGVVRNVPQDA
jgi:hypothetical protein